MNLPESIVDYETVVTKKTLLIIGAGFSQVPAIKAAQALGLKTMAIDRSASAMGMALADIALPIDIVDIGRAVAVARQYDVAGVLTMQSDVGVPTVGAIVDALGLPGNGLAIAKRCSSKIETRRFLRKHGVSQPEFRVVVSEVEALAAAQDIGFPCVIKASDSSGSRGIVKVHAADEVSDAYAEARKYTSAREILVEEFVVGLEIGAQAFSVNGRCVSVLVHDDAISAPPYMVPIGHSFPSSLPSNVLANVEQAVKTCVEALGIVSGPSNIDIILDSRNLPLMIEVGARIGATCLPELVFHYSGIDWVKAAVQAAVGTHPDLMPTRSLPCAAYILEAPEDGMLKAINIPEDMLSHPDLLELEITANLGESVSRFRKGTDRIGKVVTKGETREQADKLAREMLAAIQIKIQPSNRTPRIIMEERHS